MYCVIPTLHLELDNVPYIISNSTFISLNSYNDEEYPLSRIFLYCVYLHCTMYNVQCTLYTLYCIMYTVHCTLYNVQCTLYNVRCALYNVHFIMYGGQWTLYIVHCMYTVCTVYIVRYILYMV